MKKLKLNFQDFGNTEVLTREQLKKIVGGDGSGGPCVTNGCSRICHYTTYNNDPVWGFGNCNQQGAAGHPSICDNYCCEQGQQTYWC